MTSIRCDDGVALHVEETGQGEPILFVHEFGGEAASWDGQVAAFADRYRCIRYCARGFHPSDVPESEEYYGQERATLDLISVADALGVDRFHLVGLSMGSFTSLMASLAVPDRILSLTLAGCSSGPRDGEELQRYRADLTTEIALLERLNGDGAVKWFAEDGAYRRMPEKNPQAWRRYCERLRAQSTLGARNTLRTLHWNRTCLWSRTDALRRLPTATLLIHGDEDHAFIRPTNTLLAETLPHAGRIELARTGHLVNLEEPEAFNRALSVHLLGETAP